MCIWEEGKASTTQAPYVATLYGGIRVMRALRKAKTVEWLYVGGE